MTKIDVHPIHLKYMQRVRDALQGVVEDPETEMRIDTISFYFYERGDDSLAIRYNDNYGELTFLLEGDEVE